MRLEELKKNAEKILALEPATDFEHIPFRTRSGGGIENKAGIEPEAIIHQDSEFAYNTTANGAAYRGEIVVQARNTGTVDYFGRNVYETPGGNLFVYHYAGGSAACFDFGELRPPVA